MDGGDERLTDERAVRLLRAKAGELGNRAQVWLDAGVPGVSTEVGHLAADVALIADLLADHIERHR